MKARTRYGRSRSLCAAASLACAGAALFAVAAAANQDAVFDSGCKCRPLAVEAKMTLMRGRL